MFENKREVKKEIPTLESMYPDYTPEERAEASDTLNRYLNLVWRIYNRVKRENPKKLTKMLLNARFKRDHSRPQDN
jgi:hypothetical protein